MKQYKIVDVPASKQRLLDKTLCDLCGNEIKSGCYDAEDVEVMHRSGCSYPEGGWGKETTIDMCGQCFEEKLVPWVIEQGGKPDVRDWGY